MLIPQLRIVPVSCINPSIKFIHNNLVSNQKCVQGNIQMSKIITSVDFMAIKDVVKPRSHGDVIGGVSFLLLRATFNVIIQHVH